MFDDLDNAINEHIFRLFSNGDWVGLLRLYFVLEDGQSLQAAHALMLKVGFASRGQGRWLWTTTTASLFLPTLVPSSTLYGTWTEQERIVLHQLRQYLLMRRGIVFRRRAIARLSSTASKVEKEATRLGDTETAYNAARVQAAWESTEGGLESTADSYLRAWRHIRSTIDAAPPIAHLSYLRVFLKASYCATHSLTNGHLDTLPTDPKRREQLAEVVSGLTAFLEQNDLRWIRSKHLLEFAAAAIGLHVTFLEKDDIPISRRNEILNLAARSASRVYILNNIPGAFEALAQGNFRPWKFGDGEEEPMSIAAAAVKTRFIFSLLEEVSLADADVEAETVLAMTSRNDSPSRAGARLAALYAYSKCLEDRDKDFSGHILEAGEIIDRANFPAEAMFLEAAARVSIARMRSEADQAVANTRGEEAVRFAERSQDAASHASTVSGLLPFVFTERAMWRLSCGRVEEAFDDIVAAESALADDSVSTVGALGFRGDNAVVRVARGAVFLATRRTEGAMACFREARDAVQARLNAGRDCTPAELSAYLTSHMMISEQLLDTGNAERAAQSLEPARTVLKELRSRKALRTPLRMRVAELLLLLGETHLSTENPDAAEEFFAAAASESSQWSGREGVKSMIDTRRRLGMAAVELHRGDKETSFQWVERAMNAVRSLESRSDASRLRVISLRVRAGLLLSRLAESTQKSEWSDRAIDWLEETRRLSEEQRRRFWNMAERTRFSAEASRLFDRLVEQYALQETRAGHAIASAERLVQASEAGRSRVLIDLLGDEFPQAASAVPSELLGNLRTLREQLRVVSEATYEDNASI